MVSTTRKGPAALADERSSLRRTGGQRGRPSLPAAGLNAAEVPSITDSMRALYGTDGVISPTKPVTGRDLDMLRTRLGGLTVTDACWLFGLQRNRWYKLVNDPMPLEDVSLALVVRMLDQYPELCPIKPAPRPDWMFHWLKEVNPTLDQRTFALLFGREKSAAHRWLKLSSSVSPKIARLFSLAQTMLVTGMDPTEVMGPLAVAEGSARGLDIMRDGIWTSDDTRVRPKRRAPGERTKASKSKAKKEVETA
jgi:hypothetical protein